MRFPFSIPVMTATCPVLVPGRDSLVITTPPTTGTSEFLGQFLASPTGLLYPVRFFANVTHEQYVCCGLRMMGALKKQSFGSCEGCKTGSHPGCFKKSFCEDGVFVSIKLVWAAAGKS